MRKIGYNVYNLRNLIDHIDTKYMWQYVTRDISPRKLVAILADLGLIGWNPHNAGNDAVYTLQAMLGIAFKHLKERGERADLKRQMDGLAERRVAEAMEQAREAAREREQGWSSAGEGSDGGEGIRPVPAVPKTQARASAGNAFSGRAPARLEKFDKTKAETSWNPNNKGVARDWRNGDGAVGGLGKGIDNLSVGEMWMGKGVNAKAEPVAAKKSSKAADWGASRDGDTHGW
jgi:hypothetical protein